jgi:hypothetical protein
MATGEFPEVSALCEICFAEIFASMIIANKNGVMRNLRSFMKPMRGFLILFLYPVLFQGPNTCL